MKVKAVQLRAELHNTKLGNRTMEEYLLKIKALHEVVLQGSVGADGLYKFTDFRLSNPVKSASPASALSLDSSISAATVSNNVHATILSVSDVPNSSNLIPCNSPFTTCLRGIVGVDALKTVLRNCNISIPNKNVFDFCSSCSLGKAHRLPSPLSSTVDDAPLHLIVSDIWGPSPFVSSTGYNLHLLYHVY